VGNNLFLSQSKLLRVALFSKGLVEQGVSVPKIKQISVSVKAENSFDLINNAILLASLTGVVPGALLVNRKQGAVLPRAVLGNLLLSIYFNSILNWVIKRLNDKTVSRNFSSVSNKLTFVFKASDAISSELRKIWKLFNIEVGLFSLQVTFVTNVHEDYFNETLLRSLHFPVLIK